MNWMEASIEFLAAFCALSSLLGLAASAVVFLLFHLGVRDFQDYESEP